jgi:hypothetical protein
MRARCRGAVQTEEALHNADLDDADDRIALVATQFHVTVFHDGDNDAGTIDTSDPMWHGGHQAGEFITELAIHDTRLTRCSVQGRHRRREPWPPER